MSLNGHIRPGDNKDITEERERATFPTEELAREYYGKGLDGRRRITDEVLKDKRLHDHDQHSFQSREERMEETARKLSVLIQRPELAKPGDEQYGHLIYEVMGMEGHQTALHHIMFIPALQSQAHKELMDEMLPRAMRGEIIGTYAQTEMGHGTNLRALETTATFDMERDEFVINSPTTSSYKWWPGNLGKTSNYSVVVAQLFIEGKCYGPHSFMVQLRDEKTHEPMKGITVGDIGPKMACNTNDNGFLKCDHVRVSRSRMFMRHSKVSADGKYEKPIHAKINYGTMVFVRSYMIRQQAHLLGMASTIAVRYSCVRRQGEITPGAGEVRILDYQTQQHRLLPQVARAYAYHFTGDVVIEMYEKTLEEIKEGKIDMMKDLHAVTSGMKSVVSHEVGKGIEQCRMSCGGHGYSTASRFSELYGGQIGGCTYEGENMVMLLQLARYLMKAGESVRNGKPLTPMTEYLAQSEKSSMIGRGSDTTSAHLLKAFEYIARSTTLSAYDRLLSLQSTGITKEEAWQRNAVEMTRASRAHTRLYIANCFHRKVHSQMTSTDPRVKDVLVELLNLYLNYELLDMSHYLLQEHYISSTQLTIIRYSLYNSLAKLRPNAVSLVDSLEVSDNELRSVLGRRDGHVYENLLKWATGNPLNKTEVLPSFQKYLRPIMSQAKSKL